MLEQGDKRVKLVVCRNETTNPAIKAFSETAPGICPLEPRDFSGQRSGWCLKVEYGGPRLVKYASTLQKNRDGKASQVWKQIQSLMRGRTASPKMMRWWDTRMATMPASWRQART
ncbi:hypothetical protein TNCT_226021 [Trichonephila clavata]|uniref:Uncharacterized protein n=1 Tax=Trichonephila clavata TaxID=2740835 RepID=A0A8X6JJ91_TRICU|nr:hypothetical protein TNCT_226021 [Trichonephila clavata]